MYNIAHESINDTLIHILLRYKRITEHYSLTIYHSRLDNFLDSSEVIDYSSSMFVSAQLLSLIIPYLALVVITTTPISEFHVPILGLVTFFYLLFSFISRKKTHSDNQTQNLTTSAIILFLVLSVISLTGGTASLFFFLLYFMAFLIAFTAPPEAVFVFAATTVLFYLFLEGRTVESFSLSLHLMSVVLLSPLAYFFGKEFQEQAKQKVEHDRNEQKKESATTNISNDVIEVLKDNRATLSDESVEKLNDILEEAEEIREIDGIK